MHLIGHAVVRFDEPGVLFGETVELGKNGSTFDLNDLKRIYQKERHSFNCDLCNCEPIVGVRFKCDLCSNFDICQACFEAKRVGKSHKVEHPLIAIGKTISLEINSREVKLGDQLGEGGFGSVYKATYKNKIVACKIMSFTPDLIKSYMRELYAYNEIKGCFFSNYNYIQWWK